LANFFHLESRISRHRRVQLKVWEFGELVRIAAEAYGDIFRVWVNRNGHEVARPKDPLRTLLHKVPLFQRPNEIEDMNEGSPMIGSSRRSSWIVLMVEQ